MQAIYLKGSTPGQLATWLTNCEVRIPQSFSVFGRKPTQSESNASKASTLESLHFPKRKSPLLSNSTTGFPNDRAETFSIEKDQRSSGNSVMWDENCFISLCVSGKGLKCVSPVRTK
ncbi:hypothetical protein HNY73_001672 [Argiope bruennichi]|uniref:Uncharacterized protein n=1 Tax=Argiope bruennichi TaxID=94029 RepID=A0A8T0FTT1_ARGBR|nr:hypothetical protein HNY73_001672 [Argiope bruennichi]